MKLICSSPFHASQLCCLLLIPSLAVSPLAAQSPLAAAAPASTNIAIPGAQPSPLDNTDLQVRVVESSGTEAKVNSVPAKTFTVAVTNASGAPVADAAVAVRLPDSGATGVFADGSHAAVAYTDAAGRTSFPGLHWNQTPGEVAMRVTATKGNSHAALLLNETLTSDAATVVQVPPPAPSAAPAAPQPGQIAKAQALSSSAASPAPLQPAAVPVANTGAAKLEPTVSVTGASPDASKHSSKTKWIIIAAVVAAAAGAGVAVMGKGKSNTTPAASGLTIEAPTVGTPTH